LLPDPKTETKTPYQDDIAMEELDILVYHAGRIPSGKLT
jgi:hypothetical protein